MYSWDSWQILGRFVIKPRIHESPNELSPHSTQTTSPTNRHELINVRIRGILQISCTNRDALRFSYDTGTIELRLFVGFGSNRSNIVKNSLRFTRIDYECCTNVRNQLRISWEYSECIYKSNTIKLNSWLFLTINGISPQDRYKKGHLILASACIRGLRDIFVADSWSSHELTNPRMSWQYLRMPTNLLRFSYDA